MNLSFDIYRFFVPPLNTVTTFGCLDGFQIVETSEVKCLGHEFPMLFRSIKILAFRRPRGQWERPNPQLQLHFRSTCDPKLDSLAGDHFALYIQEVCHPCLYVRSCHIISALLLQYNLASKWLNIFHGPIAHHSIGKFYSMQCMGKILHTVSDVQGLSPV